MSEPANDSDAPPKHSSPVSSVSGGAEGGRARAIIQARFDVWVPLVILFVLVASSFALWYQSRQFAEREVRRETAITADHVRRRLELFVSTRLWLVGHVAQEVRDKPNLEASFEKTAREFTDRLDGFQAINWVDKEGTVQIVAPLEGNEKALGANLYDHPDSSVAKALRRCLETKTMQRSNVLTLLQGHSGFGVYCPVFDEKENLLGFVNGVFRTHELIDSCITESLLRERYVFDLREGKGTHVYGSGAPGELEASSFRELTQVMVLDRPWQMKFAPSQETLAASHSDFSVPLLISALAFASWVSFLVRVLLIRAERLRESRTRLAQIYRSAHDGIFVVDPEAATIIETNPRAERMLGYASGQLAGRSILELHPGDETALMEFVGEVLAHGAGSTDRLPCRMLSGQALPTEISASTMVLDGRTRILAMVRDISQRRRDELIREALQQVAIQLSESRDLKASGKLIAREARRVFDYDAFFLEYYDERGRVSIGVYNEDTPEGASEPVETPTRELQLDQVKQMAIFDVAGRLINRDAPQWGNDLIPTGEVGRPSMSLMFARIDWGDKSIGSISVQSYTAYKYSEADLETLKMFAAQCGGALSRHRAEEERKHMEAQLQHAQKLESLGVLAGGIAHDFNNLLMGILGNADLALHELSPSAPGREYIGDIVTSSQRAAELCRQMLAYSGKGKFIVQSLDLSEIVREMTHLLEISIAKSVKIHYRLASDLPGTQGDVTQVRQLVMNLVTNASEAIGNKTGVITITTGIELCDREYLSEAFHDEVLAEGPYVFCEVSDTGCGMDKETIGRIFDPFFTTKFTGRGLGLAALLGIIRAHHGAIRVYSEVGLGSTFKILLPAAGDRPKPLTPTQPAADEWRGRGTVLFADDEETVRLVGRRILERVGFDVVLACDGQEAVDIYRQRRDSIALVVLDMTMPRMSGEDAYRELRRMGGKAKIILSSGYNSSETTNRFAGKGLAGFVQKPYRAQDLIQVVRQVLNGTTTSE